MDVVGEVRFRIVKFKLTAEPMRPASSLIAFLLFFLPASPADAYAASYLLSPPNYSSCPSGLEWPGVLRQRAI
jgi:hypothetical protein